MKNKNLFLIFAILAFFFLVPTLTSAYTQMNSTLNFNFTNPCTSGCSSATVNTYLYFQSNLTATSMNVTQGNTVNLDVVAFANGEKLKTESLYWGKTLIFQDNNLGVEQVPYTYEYHKVYSLDTSVLIPGTYNLRFTATSQSGATDSSYLILTVSPKKIVDTTPPTVSINYPINGVTYSQNQTGMDVVVTDNTELQSCWYNTGSGNVSFSCKGSWTSTQIENLHSHEGSNTWRVYAQDTSGNIGSDSIIFYVKSPITPDTTAPKVKINYPNKPLYYQNVTSMNVFVNDTNLQSCWYNLGNKNVSFSCSNGANTIKGISSENGFNTWKVYAQDKAGNIGVDTVAFVVMNPIDTTPPTVMILNPKNGITYTKNQTTMEAEIQDINLNKCWYNLGDGINQTFKCYNGENFIPLIHSHEGINTWKVYAQDKAGNIGNDSVTFTVKSSTIPDTTAPTVNIISPANGLIYSNNITQMQVSINDSNLKMCWYNLGKTNVTFSCSNGINLIQNIYSKEGINTWKVYAQDKAGNVGSDKVSFVIQSPSPITPGANENISNKLNPYNPTPWENNTIPNYYESASNQTIILTTQNKAKTKNIFQAIWDWIRRLFGWKGN